MKEVTVNRQAARPARKHSCSAPRLSSSRVEMRSGDSGQGFVFAGEIFDPVIAVAFENSRVRSRDGDIGRQAEIRLNEYLGAADDDFRFARRLRRNR
jgi:hypothetical protein